MEIFHGLSTLGFYYSSKSSGTIQRPSDSLGENSQNEYGGPAAAADNKVLNRRWLEEFGGLLGLRVSDMVGQEDIEKKHLIPYTYPSDNELSKVKVTGLFLVIIFLGMDSQML